MQQLNRCLQLLRIEAASTEPDPWLDAAINAAKADGRFAEFAELLPAPEGVRRAAATVLMAGPDATPKELVLGGRTL